MKYLIIRCKELSDQFECDALREPICLTDNIKNYNKFGYEIYLVTPNNYFQCIKGYNEKLKEIGRR